jgi:L(+)-tartrate dehydratase beta subunit
MAHHVLKLPVSEVQVRSLKVGDTVTLESTLFGLRDATLIAMFDRRRTTRFDLKGHAIVHTAPNVRKVDPRPGSTCGYEPLCIGTTTSMRMERFTRPLMEREGLRLIIGKGGMGPDTLDAFRDLGGAYLAVVGGAAALETTWIEAIEDVDLDDLHPRAFGIPNKGLWPTAGHDGFTRRLAARAGQRRSRCPRAPRYSPASAARDRANVDD